MSVAYDRIIEDHHKNVKKAFYWIRKSLPELLIPIPGVDYELMILLHDDTKTIPSQYIPYDNYVCGERNKDTLAAYQYAKLEHRHMNGHHWEHWIYIDSEGTRVALDMPYEFIIEMICDWWSFSWQKDNLFAIFDWYEEHKKKIKLSKETRKTVEDILNKLEQKIIKVRGARK